MAYPTPPADDLLELTTKSQIVVMEHNARPRAGQLPFKISYSQDFARLLLSSPQIRTLTLQDRQESFQSITPTYFDAKRDILYLHDLQYSLLNYNYALDDSFAKVERLALSEKSKSSFPLQTDILRVFPIVRILIWYSSDFPVWKVKDDSGRMTDSPRYHVRQGKEGSPFPTLVLLHPGEKLEDYKDYIHEG